MTVLVVGAERIEVTGELVLGREGDVPVDDEEVSRRHARVRPAGDAVEIEDLGSSNGTWVNGARISVPTRIGTGDDVRIGRTALRVERGGTLSHGPFAPPQAPRRGRAPASRLLAPQVLAYAAVLATAAALLVYFALR